MYRYCVLGCAGIALQLLPEDIWGEYHELFQKSKTSSKYLQVVDKLLQHIMGRIATIKLLLAQLFPTDLTTYC